MLKNNKKMNRELLILKIILFWTIRSQNFMDRKMRMLLNKMMNKLSDFNE